MRQETWESTSERLERKLKKRRSRRRADRIGGVLGNLAVLAVANLYAYWIPWTGGVVTAAWPHVLWAVNLAGAVSIAGNVLLLALRGPSVKRGLALIMTAATLVSAATMYAVYPFHFAILAGPWLDSLLRGVLVLALVVTGITGLVQLLRFLFSSADETT